MAFAIQAGLAPEGATKATHKSERDMCKQIVLGVNYGMSAESMAMRSGIGLPHARDLLARHKRTYHVFWGWAVNNVNVALAGGRLTTVFGWPLNFSYAADLNPRSLLNFPMQANGAEMLRLAICKATEAGLRICAPVHDAILVEATLEEMEGAVGQLRTIMEDASREVLGCLTCRVDADIVRYPDRFTDEGGEAMWETVVELLDEQEARPEGGTIKVGHLCPGDGTQQGHPVQYC